MSHENDINHRRISGLGLFLSNSQLGEPSQDETTRDYEPTVSVKDYERPFFCKICQIDCKSDGALESHLKGDFFSVPFLVKYF